MLRLTAKEFTDNSLYIIIDLHLAKCNISSLCEVSELKGQTNINLSVFQSADFEYADIDFKQVEKLVVCQKSRVRAYEM